MDVGFVLGWSQCAQRTTQRNRYSPRTSFCFSIYNPTRTQKSIARTQIRMVQSTSSNTPVFTNIPFMKKAAIDLDQAYSQVEVENSMPQPLTPFQRAKRSLTFWGKLLPVLFKYKQMERELKDDGKMSKEEIEAKWSELHEWGSDTLASTIQELKGFYVKSGQLISSRVDLFPESYIIKLATLQDSVQPIDPKLVKAIISQELLEGEPLNMLFSSFDDEPLGSASIAQVHKAVLVDGRTVAVKVQRPSEEPKLRADVANLKVFARRLAKQLPVDYYPIFCELEKALNNELDFRAEAQAMEKIYASIAHLPNGKASSAPLIVPRPVPNMCTRRVLVMDYVPGIPISKLQGRLQAAEPDVEIQYAASKLLQALTEAYARMIFGNGFIHGDVHPGNIMVLPGPEFALLDCGQVKQLPASRRLLLAQAILSVNEYDPTNPTRASVRSIAQIVREFGVQTGNAENEDDVLAAIALLLFGPTTLETLPGGFSSKELSSSSPLKAITSFPQEFVMLGRATILIKGLAARLKMPWNLSAKWKEAAEMALACGVDGCYRVPVYAQPPKPLGEEPSLQDRNAERPKFRQVIALTKQWAKGKTLEVAPSWMRKKLIERALKKLEDDGSQ